MKEIILKWLGIDYDMYLNSSDIINSLKEKNKTLNFKLNELEKEINEQFKFQEKDYSKQIPKNIDHTNENKKLSKQLGDIDFSKIEYYELYNIGYRFADTQFKQYVKRLKEIIK
jgi:hypothetical protein